MKKIKLTIRFILLNFLALFFWSNSQCQDTNICQGNHIEFCSDLSELCCNYPDLQLCSLKSKLCSKSATLEEIFNKLCSDLSNQPLSVEEHALLRTYLYELCTEFGNDTVGSNKTDLIDDLGDPCRVG